MENLSDFEKWMDLYYVTNPAYDEIKNAISMYRELLTTYDKKRVLNALLIANKGVLVTSAFGSENMDLDIFSGMLTAINEFVADTLQGRSDYAELSYGDYRIHIVRGENAYLALLLNGQSTERIHRRGKRILVEIEIRYSSILPRWDGRKHFFTGLDIYLRKYLIDYENKLLFDNPKDYKNGMT